MRLADFVEAGQILGGAHVGDHQGAALVGFAVRLQAHPIRSGGDGLEVGDEAVVGRELLSVALEEILGRGHLGGGGFRQNHQ